MGSKDQCLHNKRERGPTLSSGDHTVDTTYSDSLDHFQLHDPLPTPIGHSEKQKLEKSFRFLRGGKAIQEDAWYRMIVVHDYVKGVTRQEVPQNRPPLAQIPPS
jgi:hypothetical protein|uniref:Uncharacterized protein n=1 Tax=Picea glauca TaxID=3330 RepID=A0A101M1X4_PICGL|nr:hypothetical protein ABT39_MTgene2766 [Picea glauca]